MNNMQQKWLEWEQKFLDLTKREKLIIGFAAVFLTAFAIYKLSIEPGTQQLINESNNKRRVAGSLQATNTQVLEITNALKIDPNEKVKIEINDLKSKIKQVEDDLAEVMTEYVAPEQMTRALTHLLQDSDGLRIVGMTALPPSIIQQNTDLTISDYYRHQFVVEITGDYFKQMEFMKTITNKNKQFSVQNLNYKVLEYPTALMTLTLITISDSKNVIRL